jgi:hypothetical protein
MNMPGFNAEYSLYRTRRCYQMVESAERSTGTLQPAYGSSCWQVCQGDPDCMQCCMCIRRGGDPSQCCF